MIYASIFDSSVARDWEALVVFIALIALADAEDNVYTDPERLSRKTNIPDKIVRKGLSILLEPDAQSFNRAEGGRRITFLPLVGTNDSPSLDSCRGFHVVNRAYYKRLLRKKYNAAYAARRRQLKYSDPENRASEQDVAAALEDFRN